MAAAMPAATPKEIGSTSRAWPCPTASVALMPASGRRIRLKPLLTRGTAPAIDPRDFFRRYFIFRHVPPGEPDEDHIGGRHADRDQPPDVPDQREAGDGGEEGGDKSGRDDAGDLDGLVDRLRPQMVPLEGQPLDLPIGLLPSTFGSTAKLKAGGGDAVAHSSERPSQGSPVSSRKASRSANTDNELDNLRDRAEQQKW